MAWELCRGSIPEGMFVLHRCDNPGCCNPNHLFLGSQRINVEDMITKGRAVFPPGLGGEKCGMHKLSWEEVNGIRFGAALGGSEQFLAECYDTTQPTVSRILRNKTWKL